MTTLAEFLLARIAEDEAAAKAAKAESPTPWSDDGGTLDDADRRSIAGYAGEFTSPYIARYDPDRVLLECEGKRRIVRELQNAERCAAMEWLPAIAAEVNEYLRSMTVAAYALCYPYAYHPDFRPEWRVQASSDSRDI